MAGDIFYTQVDPSFKRRIRDIEVDAGFGRSQKGFRFHVRLKVANVSSAAYVMEGSEIVTNTNS